MTHDTERRSRLAALLPHARALAAWFARRDLQMLAGFLAVFFLAWCFVELAELVTEGAAAAVDRRVLMALRRGGDGGDPIGPRWLEQAFVDVTALGSSTVATLVVVIGFGFLLLAGKPRIAMLLVACSAGAGLAIQVLKSAFDRGRPDMVKPLYVAEGLSFPSGHATIGAALYLTLGALVAGALPKRRLRVYVVIIALLLALLIGVSRVYIGVHYPTDVLAGWTVGLAWALACGLVQRALQRRGTVEEGPRNGGE